MRVHGGVPIRMAGPGIDQARTGLAPARPVAEAARPDRGSRSVAGEVRPRAPQVEVPALDARLRRVLRLAGRLVVRSRTDSSAVRARDGTRARGEEAGTPRVGSGVHSVHGSVDLDEAAPARCLA